MFVLDIGPSQGEFLGGDFRVSFEAVQTPVDGNTAGYPKPLQHSLE